MKGARKFADKLLRLHLGQLDRLITTQGTRGLNRLYTAARADLQTQLRAAVGRNETANPAVIRAMLKQLDGAVVAIGQSLEDHLNESAGQAAQLGGKHAVTEFKKLSEFYTGTTPVMNLDNAALFSGLVQEVDSSLFRRHRTLSKAWSLRAIHDIEQQLAVGAMTGKHMHDIVDVVMAKGGIADEQRYRADRIVRTEMAYAHGAAKQAAMLESRGDRPALMKRLIETIDDRTGDDSFVIHGQTVPVDQAFSWKRKRRGAWVAESFMHPPNRPNDRASVIPWDPEWEETDLERPLTVGELKSAPPTRWRSTVGVDVPPGHKPGRPDR